MDQNPLAGNARWSDGNRIASASIRNITKPRKASMDVIRVGAETPIAGRSDNVDAGADTVVSMMPGILMPLGVRASNGSLIAKSFSSDPFLTAHRSASRLPQLR
jgi:hypothetical protein